MTTINTTEKSLKKFPFSEAELLENIDEDNAHSDECGCPHRKRI